MHSGTHRQRLPKQEPSLYSCIVRQLKHYFDTFWIVCGRLRREAFGLPLLLLLECLTWNINIDSTSSDCADWHVGHRFSQNKETTHSPSPLLSQSGLSDLLLLLPDLLLLLPLLPVLLLVCAEGGQIGLVLLLPEHLGLVPLLPENKHLSLRNHGTA